MKILITTDVYTVKTNGVATSVTMLADELNCAGYDVRILTFSNTIHSHKENNVYYIGSASLNKIYPGLRKPLKNRHPYVEELIRWKPDVIHSQCEFFSFGLAKRIAKETSAPLVHTYHTLYEQYIPYILNNRGFGEYILRLYMRIRLKSVCCIIAPSNKTKMVLERYKISKPIKVIPSGVNAEKFRKKLSETERKEFRESINADDRTVLLSLGRLGIEKNIDELLVFLSRDRDKKKNLLLIVGDGPARAGLEDCVQQLQIEDKVTFAGMVPPDEVYRYYQSADVFVCASTSETQGLTYIEAIANGLPLLCRNDPCLNGVLINGENGYTYDTVDEFYDGLNMIASKDNLCGCRTETNAQIMKTYSSGEFGKNVIALYCDVTKITDKTLCNISYNI